jgi:hypothetical protein
MKTFRPFAVLMTLVFFLLGPLPVDSEENQQKENHAQETTPEEDTSSGQEESISGEKDQNQNPAVSDDLIPIYKPPFRGAPIGRIAGGTRTHNDPLPFLCVIVPEHTGLSVHQSPSLHWFISELTRFPIVLTVIEKQALRPLLETTLTSIRKKGIQRIHLSDYGVKLQNGVQYKWFVSVVPDPDHRSRDIIAGGAIECVEIPKDLQDRLKEAEREQTPHLYAESGLWYDALSAVSDLIESDPGNSLYRRQRSALIAQIGLADIAQYGFSP